MEGCMKQPTPLEYLVLRDLKGDLRVAAREGARKLAPFAAGCCVVVAEGLTFPEACERYFRARFDETARNR